MELAYVKGIKCVKKKVKNLDVHYLLSTISDLNVPQIIKIEGNDVYYSYIEGKSLREVLYSKGISNEDVKDIFIQMITVLDGLKKYRIVHRDIKPENVILTEEGQVFLIDFGSSRVETNKPKDTTLLGTEGYASPEQYGYESTTFKSDIYSLGQLIREMDKGEKYKQITNKMTAFDPVNRPDNYEKLLKEISKDNFFSKIDFAKKITNRKEEPKGLRRIIMIQRIFDIPYIIMSVLIIATEKQFHPNVNTALAYAYICFFIRDIGSYLWFLLKIPYRKGENIHRILVKLAVSVGAFIIIFIIARIGDALS